MKKRVGDLEDLFRLTSADTIFPAGPVLIVKPSGAFAREDNHGVKAIGTSTFGDGVRFLKRMIRF